MFLFLLQSGEIDIVNHKTGDKCNLKFVPYSYFSRDVARKVREAGLKFSHLTNRVCLRAGRSTNVC